MNYKHLLVLLFSAAFYLGNCQSPNNEILFTLADAPVYTTEFLRVYNKNLDLVKDESQKGVDDYLKLFINYKLKLKEAKALNLQEKPSYKQELDGYKSQLAKGYMSDSKITVDLIKEAYYRISNEVNASHILVKVDQNATPQDTLSAYNTIVKIRERVENEGFDVVKKDVNDQQTIFGEDLGYFGGFRMVYKFENAAFNTNVGETSQPFRTQFGYHIIHVKDKRASKGERTVAHIMVVEKPNDSLTEKPESRIQDIYKKLKQGEDFEALAKQFSDDRNSAPNGGKLAPFTSGQINSKEFEDMAFGLTNIDDVSQPFKTAFGWHIMKLLGKKPIEPFESIKAELEQKVKQDERSKIIDKALYKKLKTKYNVTKDQPALPYFSSIINDNFFRGIWEFPKDFKGDKPLVKIGNKQLTYLDFGNYLKIYQQNALNKIDANVLISETYETFLKSNLIKYQEDALEEENEDFATIVQEYRDGLLLFDLMETTIWNSAKTDSLQIENYYNLHKNKYMTSQRVDAIVASSKNKKTLEKVAKLLEKGLALEHIKKQFNTNDKIDVIFTKDTMDGNHQALPKDFEFKKGISKIYDHNDAFLVVNVIEVLPETIKSFKEAKGLVISDYQVFKEEEWLKELANKYPIKLNQEAFNTIKNQIKN